MSRQDVGVTGDANMIEEPQIQPLDCPDNGLLRFDDWEGVFYAPLHIPKNLDKPPCFLAKLCKASNEVQVVVKFVYNHSGTYGENVHEYLYQLGLAPRLYSAVNLHCGLVMVVMEHLTFKEGVGGWVELDTFENKLGSMAGAVRKKLEKIIDSLQDKKMVHADLRPKNIMIQVDKDRHITMSENEPVLSLIDFDWAGTVGEARYPPFLNHRIRWPTGAKGYKHVGEGDDRLLLSNWWDEFTAADT